MTLDRSEMSLTMDLNLLCESNAGDDGVDDPPDLLSGDESDEEDDEPLSPRSVKAVELFNKLKVVAASGSASAWPKHTELLLVEKDGSQECKIKCNYCKKLLTANGVSGSWLQHAEKCTVS